MLTEQGLTDLFEHFRALGFIIAILLPFIEAFLPVLPIALFAVVNANSYGVLLGFLYTYIGATLGAYFVFLLVRKYGQHRFLRHLNKHPHTTKLIQRIDEKGALPLFILLCFPFTPSSVVNVVAGLSTLSKRSYMIAVIFGKMVMLFLLSYIGSDVYSFVKYPEKSIIVLIILLILWLLGKLYENRLHKD